ncbi:MAG TPA: response regulator transcription factor [Actinomycetales bacterium]|nr:response regulator transcription factor [Actinomycetales bacterium]
MNILLVEDDLHVAQPLTAALRRKGYEVTAVATGAQALAGTGFDLVLLDLGLPDVDGLAVCRKLRHRSATGIIVLTARAREEQRVAGLSAGADDYVVKPFSMAELHARIEAVLRRAVRSGQEGLECAGLRLDCARREATRHGRPLTLTRKEFDLLTSLLRRRGGVATRDQLLLEVWHTDWHSAGRSLDVHMATLRAKLGEPVLLETVRGVGYRLALGID